MLKYISWVVPRRIASQIAALIVGSIFIHVILLGIIASYYFSKVEDNPLIRGEPTFVRMVLLTRMFAATKDAGQRMVLFNVASTAWPSLKLEDYQHAMSTIPKGDDQINEATGWSAVALPNLQAELGMKIKIGTNLETPENDRILVALENGFAFSFLVPSQLESGFPAVFNLLAVLGSFAIVLMVISVWAANRLGSPLSRLATAASKFDADQPFASIPERGPTEVIKVARAFNEMGRRTSQLVEDRTHLIAAISHDLRTPITRVRLRVETISDNELQSSILKDLSVMERMVHSALSFVRDMRSDQSLQSVDLNSLMQTICDDYYDMGRSVVFDSQLRISIFCNQDQITRAVTNIIENGLNFGSSVTLELVETVSGTVDIVVTDDGPGIPDAQKGLVLKPFKRGDEARSSESHEGFGLGLSICAAILKSHRGNITLEDVVPHGLRVRLRLPVGDKKSPSTT
jgi:signal transduction histidine kinase